MYALVFGSRKPIAVRFKYWVFDEVLPKLRKATELARRFASRTRAR